MFRLFAGIVKLFEDDPYFDGLVTGFVFGLMQGIIISGIINKKLETCHNNHGFIM